ncbi:MAG: TIM-barrel domain-containing protein [Myxococcota bacterium]|nr:TIM-barrel domain-containing protein [Myxococcota bacterium]
MVSAQAQRVVAGAMAIVFCFGCDGGHGDAQPSTGGQRSENITWVSSGEGRLGYNADTETLYLAHGDVQRTTIKLDRLAVGIVSELEDDFNYDPSYLRDEYSGTYPRGFAWEQATVQRVDPKDDGFDITLSFGNEAGQLTIRTDGKNRFKAHLKPPKTQPIAYLRVEQQADRTEGFYGLGEVFDDVNHRGKLRPMHILPELTVESGVNDVHAPIPLLIGTTGWGCFVESYYPMLFEVAVDDDETVAFAVGTSGENDNELIFYVFTESHPLDITRHYFEITGWPKLPAPWALGPWIWRDENKDQAQVQEDMATIRALDLATSGYWIDRPYASGVNSFDFDPEKFPAPQQMIDELHANGFRFALWHTPYISDEEANVALKAEVEEQGYYPPQWGLISRWGPLIDLTNADAYAWWQTNLRKYTEMGVEGFKLDYGEEVVPGIGQLRSGWRFDDGSTDRTMHAVYQLLYHQVYAELMPEAGGFMLTRTATWGDQKNGIILWPGDLDATLSQRDDEIQGENGPYGSVGGLSGALIAGLSLGPSGFPFYGSDTGGYRNAPPNRETFTRWFQQTSLSTVMQIGTNTNDVACEFNEANGFDQEMLDWYRIYTRLHLRLFPYEWTYAQDILTTGRAIQRPFGLQYPTLNHHPSDLYFFGDDLLVAPVLEAGATTKQIQFPPGVWFDWWTGEAYESASLVQVDAPLDTLPLYLRAGGIVPLLRPTIDTLSPTTVDDIESYADDPGQLYVRIGLGANHQFTVFDGTRISMKAEATRHELMTEAGNRFQSQIRLEAIGLTSAPARVGFSGDELPSVADVAALDDIDAGWVYEASRRRLHIQVPMGQTVYVDTLD